jgi:periplasmic copper chaperone A
MNARLASVALALMLPLGAFATPQVSDAWARPTVEGQRGGGGFLRITGGPQADRLLGASSAVAKTVELHQMSHEGGVMRMRAVDAIEVPAGGTVELKPGGLHLMFIDLRAPLAIGSEFAIELRFEKAGLVKVPVKVTPRGP